MVIEISNVNIRNHSQLKVIARIAGCAASIETVNETTASIDIGTYQQRKEAAVSEGEIESMIFAFVRAGFAVRTIGNSI